jgi:hypothetical protein
VFGSQTVTRPFALFTYALDLRSVVGATAYVGLPVVPVSQSDRTAGSIELVVHLELKPTGREAQSKRGPVLDSTGDRSPVTDPLGR